MGTKIKHNGWESQNNYLARKVKALERNKAALVKSRDYLMASIAETNKTHVAERQERQKALDMERQSMQKHLARLRVINQKILMEARKAVASVVLVSPTERTKADETELKCFIQVIEAWALEQEFKLASLTPNAHYDPRKLEEIRRLTESEPGDQFWGTSLAAGRAIHHEVLSHPGKVPNDMMKKIVMKHTINRRGGTK